MTNLTGTWVLDNSHTDISFVARHAMITKVRGKFDDFDAIVTIDEADQSKNAINVVIKTTSVNTGNADRDGHVRGEDFFSVEQFPEMTFVATGFDPQADAITGDLTLKGNTKQVSLNVDFFGIEEDPFGNVRAGFEASTKINRKEYGVDFQAPLGSGGVLVSEDIKIEIDGSGIKQA